MNPASDTSSKLRLRTAQPSDIPAMEALIGRSGIELSVGFYTPEQAQAVTRHVFGVDTQVVADHRTGAARGRASAAGAHAQGNRRLKCGKIAEHQVQ